MLNMAARFGTLFREDAGQDLIEYALLASLIAIAALVTVGEAGSEVDRLWTAIATGIKVVP